MNINMAYGLGLAHEIFHKFNRLSISALGLHVILLYVIGSIKHAVRAEDDDRTDIVIQGLVETSLSACFQCCTHDSQRRAYQLNKIYLWCKKEKDGCQQHNQQGSCQRNEDVLHRCYISSNTANAENKSRHVFFCFVSI